MKLLWARSRVALLLQLSTLRSPLVPMLPGVWLEPQEMLGMLQEADLSPLVKLCVSGLQLQKLKLIQEPFSMLQAQAPPTPPPDPC